MEVNTENSVFGRIFYWSDEGRHPSMMNCDYGAAAQTQRPTDDFKQHSDAVPDERH
jgi:hypothetical protein